jgi:hypothetical protein
MEFRSFRVSRYKHLWNDFLSATCKRTKMCRTVHSTSALIVSNVCCHAFRFVYYVHTELIVIFFVLRVYSISFITLATTVNLITVTINVNCKAQTTNNCSVNLYSCNIFIFLSSRLLPLDN